MATHKINPPSGIPTPNPGVGTALGFLPASKPGQALWKAISTAEDMKGVSTALERYLGKILTPKALKQALSFELPSGGGPQALGISKGFPLAKSGTTLNQGLASKQAPGIMEAAVVKGLRTAGVDVSDPKNLTPLGRKMVGKVSRFMDRTAGATFTAGTRFGGVGEASQKLLPPPGPMDMSVGPGAAGGGAKLGAAGGFLRKAAPYAGGAAGAILGTMLVDAVTEGFSTKKQIARYKQALLSGVRSPAQIKADIEMEQLLADKLGMLSGALSASNPPAMQARPVEGEMSFGGMPPGMPNAPGGPGRLYGPPTY